MTTAGSGQIDRFVPELARRRLARSPAESLSLMPQSLPAAVVFADVSGFTRLGQSLTGLGAGGAEQLTQLLNTYYGALIDLIYDHGGDVVRFAGDALMAVWAVDPESDGPTDLAEAVVRAGQCCLVVQQQLTGFEVTPGVRLSLRTSVAAGEVTVGHIGGVGDAWQLAVVGSPLDQLRRADAVCPVGQVVISPEAAAEAGPRLSGRLLTEGHLLLEQIDEPLEPKPLERTELADESWHQWRALVPATVVARIDAGQGDWLADLLHVTAVFLRLNWIDQQKPLDIEALQTATQLLQSVALQYRGTVLQLMVDDKGTVGIVCFGLPPYEGEDRTNRALGMTAALAQPLADAGMKADIGLAAGPAFCGPLGSPRHQQFTVMGNVMNLAARLMQHAQGEVLCDEQASSEAASRFTLQALPRYRFKGIADPQAVFRLVSGTSGTRAHEPDSPLLGRQKQLEMLHEALRQTLAGENTDVVVEGEPGIGKSALISNMTKAAKTLGMLPLVGECSLIEQTTAYFPWRQVFTRLLGLDQIPDPAAQRLAVLSRLPESQHRIASLVNPLLGTDLPETELVRQLSGTTRADNLHALLIELLRSGVRQHGALAVILDDMQWADWTSWQLALLVAKDVHPLTLAVFMRTMPEPHPPAYTELLTQPGLRHIKLELLSADDTAALVRQRLGVDRISPRLAELVYDRSQGNPFFAEEVVNLLRDTGAVLVVDGVCDLVGEHPNEVPRRVGDLITSRVNQLAPPQRLTLQVASVVGRVFPWRPVHDVYPVEQNRPQVGQYLNGLERHELVRQATAQPDTVWAFRHGTIQQVTYDQIPRGQRATLHRRIALWYETVAGANEACYPLLAWHWGEADDLENELKYLDLAGDHALRTGAGREAVKLFEKARSRLSSANDADDPQGQKRLAHWTRLLGEAYFQLGDLVEGRRYATEALQMLGYSVPQTSRQTKWSLLVQAAVQLWHRVLRLRPRKGDAPLGENQYRAMEAALANQRISQICYFTNDIETGIDRALGTLNIAERIPQSPVLAVSYANLSIIASLLRVDRLARLYARLAERTARDINDMQSLAYTLTVTSMYWMGRGKWNQVRQGSQEAIDVCEQLGDKRQLTEAVTVLAMLTCFVSEFEASLSHFDRVRTLGEQTQNILHRAWGHCGRGECLFRLNQLDEAQQELEAAWKLLENRKDRTEEIRAAGLLSLLHWVRGRHDQARRYADTTERLIAESAHATVSTLEGFAGMTEVRLRDWQQAPRDANRRAAAMKAMVSMNGYARVFPVGLPRIYRFRGLVQHIEGNAAAAMKLWKQSLQHAEQLGLYLETRLTKDEMQRAGSDARV